MMDDLETEPLVINTPPRPVNPDIWPQKWKYWKNLLALSVAFTFNFTAYASLQNLESSLNRDKGLGLASLSVIYGSLIISCLVAPAIIRTLGLKWTFFVSILFYAGYTATNYYAKFYTLIPASVFLGFAAGPLWASQGAYVTTSAINYAEVTIELEESIINRFNGVFLMFFQSSQIWGNLIASLVFHHSDNSSHSEDRVCGAKDCPAPPSQNSSSYEEPSEKTQHILISIYLGCGVIAALIILVFLDPLNTRTSKETLEDKRISSRLLSTLRLLKNYRMILMLPLMVYSGVEQAYIAGDYTQSFVSCSLGVQMVGYVMIAFGITDALASLLFGRIQEYVGRIALFILGAITHLGLMVVMLLWQPTESHEWLFFVVAALWGLGDAVWQTQIASFVGVLFPEDQEPAFSNYRLWQALGFTITFAYSHYLCVNAKLYIAGGLLAVSMLMYGTVEYKIRHVDIRYAEI
ncbi:protein unc-93 homolog A-like [Ptychodera flava]|uniref:protein unc-93 homolog A-like n=1 Tax=Ptychodera flava TaxID=63121 RepID=UPI00396A3124